MTFFHSYLFFICKTEKIKKRLHENKNSFKINRVKIKEVRRK